MLKTIFFGTLASALNKVLSLDPESYRSLTSLHDKRVQLELTNTGINACLVFTANGVELMDSSAVIADITLRGSPGAIIKLCVRGTPSLYQSEVTISGDMGLAAELQKIFQRLELDWEGGLAEYTGDVAAYHTAKLLRNSWAFTRQLQHNLGVELKDYLQEEIQWLPGQQQMSHFLAHVAQLRDDVERLAARINLLSSPTPCN